MIQVSIISLIALGLSCFALGVSVATFIFNRRPW